MYHRLALTATRESIEDHLDLPFRYPGLYVPRPIIYGRQEATIPVVTMSDRGRINYAIWGMLPGNFGEDWSVFQQVHDTLNVPGDLPDSGLWYSGAFTSARCLIIVSGFFTYLLVKGDIIPHYVYAASGAPMCLGGLYSELEDGFLTCTLVLVQANAFIERIQDLDRGMPMILDRSEYGNWLDSATGRKEILRYLRPQGAPALKAHPVSRDLYRQEIAGKHPLEPVSYACSGRHPRARK